MAIISKLDMKRLSGQRLEPVKIEMADMSAATRTNVLISINIIVNEWWRYVECYQQSIQIDLIDQ